jgi:uncharacterized membrane protein
MYWNVFCGPWPGWWPFHGPLFMIVIGLVVVFGLSRLFTIRHEAGVKAAIDPAMDTLRQRYADGEISEEDYLQRKVILK